MADESTSKDELRRIFLEARYQLSDHEVEEKSEAILQRILVSGEFSKAGTIHSYISIFENNEVDTISFISQCLDHGKKVVVPKIIGEGLLDHIQLTSLKNLEVNNWGIREPSSGSHVSIKNIDLVIVPMVAGDQFKNRLGYGKGFYDRFLKNCPAIKMGLLFDCQLSKMKLPVDSFDIPLDILITESKRID